MIKYFFILIIIFAPLIIFGQGKPQFVSKLESEATKYLRAENYYNALASYEKLYEYDSTNIEYAYYTALCNLYSRKSIPEAIRLFEKIKNTSNQNHLLYYLAWSYMLKHEYRKAIELFKDFLNVQGINPNYSVRATRKIEQCMSGINLMNTPVNVSFENLGPTVNSTLDDIMPFVPEDESFIIFTSNKRFDQLYAAFAENVYKSDADKNGWTLPVAERNINTYDHERAVGLSPDGKILFVCNHNFEQFSEVQEARLRGRGFRYFEKSIYNEVLMNKQYINGVALNATGDVIFVSAKYADTYGGTDIYTIRKLPDGTWSKPSNIGITINTVYDECCPSISPDGKTLYFASKGHNSIGGYDLFVSHFNEQTGEWSKPNNLGYPINTSDDNLNISFAGNRKYAYVSTYRADSHGGQDIYRITFNNEDDAFTVIKGKIFTIDGENITDKKVWDKDPYDLEIVIYDKDGNKYGNYTYNNHLGRFIAILPPGKYNISVESDGYKSVTEDLELLDRSFYIPEIEKEFFLKKK